MARIGNYIQQIRGVSYKPADLFVKHSDKAIAVYRANNIVDDGQLLLDDLIWVDKKCVKEQQIIQKDDILICASSGSKHLVGKAAQINSDINGTFGAFCKVIRPKSTNARYIGYFFQSPMYRREIAAASAGVNINNIRSEDIDSLEIELPDMKRQSERVVLLDKLSEMIGKRKKQILFFDNLVKSQFIEMFGNPIFNTKCLPIILLSRIASLKSGKNVTAKDLHEYSENTPYPCYGGNGVRGYVDKFSHDGEFCLIGRQGALCGNVQFASGKFYPTEHAVVVTQIAKDNEIWLFYCLKYLDLNRLQMGAAQPGLNIDILNQVQIPQPGKREQNQFAAFVEQTDKSKDCFESEVAA